MQVPPSWFVEALSDFACEIYKNTAAKKPLARVSLASDFGPSVGLVPGTSMDVHTAAGYVEVYCERVPRSYGTFPVGD